MAAAVEDAGNLSGRIANPSVSVFCDVEGPVRPQTQVGGFSENGIRHQPFHALQGAVRRDAGHGEKISHPFAPEDGAIE